LIQARVANEDLRHLAPDINGWKLTQLTR
jgi:hypothetical protein